MIGIVDYGIGNLGSVANACRFLGLPAATLDRPRGLDRIGALILPGVGAFGDGTAHLEQRGWTDALRDWIAAGRPLLGICLGLQLLLEESEESPGARGLAVVAGRVRRFPAVPGCKVPHMGWNRVWQSAPPDPVFEGIEDGAHFYFVHSFFVVPADPAVVAARAEHGIEFCSAARIGSVFATQFHPEKSHAAGLRLLRNFAAQAGIAAEISA